MEKLVSKRRLADEQIPPLITDKRRAMETFGEILARGRSFYPDHDAAKGYPRVYRIVALAQS